MASTNFDFPHNPPPFHPSQPPPTPPHVLPPPSPHVRPTPPPLPPSPDNNHTTVIVIVFVSFGGLFFLCFLAFGLFCLIKKRKTKKKIVKETDLVHFDEHLKMKEAIVEGPHGPKAVVLEIEDDVHVDEKVVKKEEEKFKSEILHGHNISVEGGNRGAGTSSTMPSSSSSTSDGHKHLQLEHKA